jgi:CBS domain-containing protein
MRDHDIGDVIVTKQDGSICGILTDRDIVIRSVAEAAAPQDARVEDICTHQLYSVGPDDSTGDVIRIMRDQALRRVPVIENGDAVGIVSIGDLAAELDADSALGEISAAPPND